MCSQQVATVFRQRKQNMVCELFCPCAAAETLIKRGETKRAAAVGPTGVPVGPDGTAPPNKILFAQNLPEATTGQMLAMLFQQYPGFHEVGACGGKWRCEWRGQGGVCGVVVVGGSFKCGRCQLGGGLQALHISYAFYQPQQASSLQTPPTRWLR
jgi:hypothetical protein